MDDLFNSLSSNCQSVYMWSKFNFLKYQSNVLGSHLLLNLNYPVDLINMTRQTAEKKIVSFHFRQADFKIWVLALVQIALTILLLLFLHDCVALFGISLCDYIGIYLIEPQRVKQ